MILRGSCLLYDDYCRCPSRLVFFHTFLPIGSLGESSPYEEPYRFLGGGFWIADKIFYARYYSEFSREQLFGQSCAENFAVNGRVAAGLVKVAERVLVLILILGPCVSRRPALLRSGVDGVVMRSLGLFFPVMDVFVIPMFFLFSTSDPTQDPLMMS